MFVVVGASYSDQVPPRLAPCLTHASAPPAHLAHTPPRTLSHTCSIVHAAHSPRAVWLPQKQSTKLEAGCWGGGPTLTLTLTLTLTRALRAGVPHSSSSQCGTPAPALLRFRKGLAPHPEHG